MELEFSRKYDIKFVANYIRKSRVETLEDLEKHRMILAELCKKSKFKFVEYLEVGTSDSIDMRPKISQLLKEVEEGMYDAVCVVDYDRLGRGDLGEQDRLKKAFQKSETLIITPEKIYDLNDDIDDTYADLKGFFARQEYKMITKRLRQGKKVGARRGQWTNGIPPFPYAYQRYMDKYNPKGLVIHDERYKIYRVMIELALQGVPPKKISVDMNIKGFLTPKGNYWSGVAVHRLLIDETHLGKIISNKSQGDGHKIKRPNAKDMKRIPKDEWITIENCHEPVKTQEEHDIILKLLTERQQVPRRSRQQAHIFSGLIKCALCGHGITFMGKEENARIKPCWYINAFGNKCKNNGALVSVLEKIVLDEIARYKESFLTEPDKNQETTFSVFQKKLKENKELLDKKKKALNILNDAYEMGEYTKEQWLERKRKREKEITDLTDESYNLQKLLDADPKIINDKRKENLAAFFDNITTTLSNSDRNELYTTIIDSIIWYRNGDDISVKINFK